MIGTVAWYNANKGFGFITPADGGRDVFVHRSEIELADLDALIEGQHIIFEIGENRGRKHATNLRVEDE